MEVGPLNELGGVLNEWPQAMFRQVLVQERHRRCAPGALVAHEVAVMVVADSGFADTKLFRQLRSPGMNCHIVIRFKTSPHHQSR